MYEMTGIIVATMDILDGLIIPDAQAVKIIMIRTGDSIGHTMSEMALEEFHRQNAALGYMRLTNV